MNDGSRVQQLLGLSGPPIAIGYFAEPPAGVEPYDGAAVPAGCSFWRLARQGQSFYTQHADHLNCAVGSYTHGIEMPAERAGELEATIGLMVESGYLRMEEVPGIPVLAKSHRYVAYGPADGAGFAPDVVIVPARPAQAMLLYEAALRAGAGGMAADVLGRPGCAIEPLVANSGQAAFSFGCMGNRTFSGLSEDEMYIAVPGARWPDVVAALEDIVAANQRMGAYYTGQAARFGG